MHPAIGQLSNGQFYAYLNGYQAEPTYAASAAELERKLHDGAGAQPAPVAAAAGPQPCRPGRSRVLRAYVIDVSLKHPSATHPGCSLTIDAYDQKQAISLARQQVHREALYDRHDGPLIYTARRVDD